MPACTKVGVLKIYGSGNVMASFKLGPTDPCCHGNEIFACYHKSSVSAKQRRVTITLGVPRFLSIIIIIIIILTITINFITYNYYKLIN